MDETSARWDYEHSDVSPRLVAALAAGIGTAVVAVPLLLMLGYPGSTQRGDIGALPTPPAPRLPQDVNVSPQAPPALPLNRPVGTSPTQNAFVQQRISNLQSSGATDFRVNQHQVDINGIRVGVNRPDLQYTHNGQRYYEEFDRPPPVRADAHKTRILANDPAGVVNLFTVP